MYLDITESQASMAEAAAKASAQGSPFWQFSLALYRVPQVAAACIRLQDEAGADVNLLFFLLWQASLNRKLSRDEIVAVDAKVAAWRQTAVIPLRELRRKLKREPMLANAGSAELFRTKVKGLELEAERLQQEVLYDSAQTASFGAVTRSSDEAARANIAGYESFLGRRFSSEAVDVIVGAFIALQRRQA